MIKASIIEHDLCAYSSTLHGGWKRSASSQTLFPEFESPEIKEYIVYTVNGTRIVYIYVCTITVTVEHISSYKLVNNRT